MNCQEWEQSIALWVEGDLLSPDRERVGVHLSSCAACRSFADALAETQTQLKLMRNEDTEGAALQGVRTRVMEELEANRAGTRWLPGWGWTYACGGAAALLALSLGFWVLPRDTSDFGVTIRGPEPVAEGSTPSEAVPLVPSRPEPEAQAAVAEAGPPSPPPGVVGNSVRDEYAEIISETRIEPVNEPEMFEVKLLTDDPNVVIYWLVDQDGG